MHFSSRFLKDVLRSFLFHSSLAILDFPFTTHFSTSNSLTLLRFATQLAYHQPLPLCYPNYLAATFYTWFFRSGDHIPVLGLFSFVLVVNSLVSLHVGRNRGRRC